MKTDTMYFYAGRLAMSLDEFKSTVFEDIFANAYEAVFSSMPYEEYKECILNCTSLMDEVAERLYKDKKYVLAWEQNPSVQGNEEAVSPSITGGIKPWDPSEILRFYIVPSNTENETVVMTPMIVSVYGGKHNQISLLSSSKTIH